MGETHQREAAIFDSAMELPPEERAAYLDQACGGDAGLRRRVEALLKACESQCVFLDSPAGTATAPLSAVLPGFEKPGDTIGRYKLLERIGEGGCGVVYVAEQAEPIRRRVALKIIKLGMDTRSVIARFEAERQALAMMDHPNIAKVFDAGATETGRPYFVMELVRGLKITDYCDQAKLSTRARLDLFIHVCQAIQHAHQKGIIHRDIKPSNILVTVNDGVPVPKVIDFGIAKATAGQQLTDKTIYTAFEQFIGTPAYVSPEQAVLTSLDIDTRSDIYALGVLLYELLTGRTPFDAKELLAIGLDEMRRTIREQEPPRPSTRVSTLPGQELSTTAQRRGLDAPKLVSELRGDLDWIVMKALEKDRARRYETANGLAADIQRHINNEPVVACPPSRTYQLQKLVRRNKVALSAATVVATVLVAGVIMSAWQARRAKAERDSAEAVLKFFQNHILAAGRPEGWEGGLGKDVTLRKAIDAAEPQIGAIFENRPAVEATIRHTLAESYQYLGERASAIRQAERALSLRRRHSGAEHSDTLQSMSLLGSLFTDAGQREQSVALLEDAFKLQKRKLGSEDPATLKTMKNLTEAYAYAGKSKEAVAMGEEALNLCRAKLAREDPLTGEIIDKLSEAYFFSGQPEKAIPVLEEALRLRKATLGPQRPDTASVMHNLAFAFSFRGQLDQAASLYAEALQLEVAIFGPQDRRTLNTLGRFVSVLLDQRKYDQAEKLIAEIIPPDVGNHRQPEAALRVRGNFHARRGRFAPAAADMIKAKEANPQDHVLWHKLAVLLVATGQLDAYREHCRRSADRFGNAVSPNVAERIAKDCLIVSNSEANMDTVMRMADTAAAATNHGDAAWFQFVKGLAEYRQGFFKSAIDWMNKALARPDEACRSVEAYTVLAMSHYQLKQSTEAAAAFAHGVEIAEKKLPKLESGDIGAGWEDWIIAQALMREAKALMEGNSETNAETK